MDRADGYTARWHLINGMPIPKGPALDYVLAALEPTLGALPGGPDKDEDEDAPAIVAQPVDHQSFPEYREIPHATRNMGGDLKPLGIVFHSTYGNATGSLSWIKNSASRVSYHTIIFPNGERHNVVPFNRVAWHAGRSTFKGRSGCNSFTIGLAFEGNLYSRSLSDDEINSAVEIAVKLMRGYGISIDWVTDHRTISPGRKEDIPPATLAMLKDRIAERLNQ